MLARRMPAILPPFTFEEALETTKIHSVAKVLDSRTGLVGVRPFRSPHHTISDAGLIGGGMIPRPGKVSLAHNGGLFLDELPEFPRNVLEVMRQPLEDGTVCIRTGRGVAYLSGAVHAPHCKEPLPLPRVPQRPNPGMPLPAAADPALHSKISGPLMDQHRYPDRRPGRELQGNAVHEPSGKLSPDSRSSHARPADPVGALRRQPTEDLLERANRFGADSTHCELSADCERRLEWAMTQQGLSARAHDRILKVARTIADLESVARLEPKHMAEAIQYRTLDRTYWA
jgi:magnesium chelatase family protein